MNKNIKFLIVILSVFFISGFLVCVNGSQVLGAYDFKKNTGLTDTAEQTGHVVEDGSTTWFPNATLPDIIGQALGIILTFLGAIFLILMIYGGYIWMMAKGNEEETNKAKSIIRNALIGLIIVLAARVITTMLRGDFYLYI